MILVDLKVHNFRNISTLHLSLNPRFNLIVGPNGSGKSSILEALYLLSCGHSFRSRELSPIISHQKDSLTVFARSTHNDTISIQKSCSFPTQIKLNNSPCLSTSRLAYTLPCQLFYSDLFQIIDSGPSVRRTLLDWGLFHVKQNYLLVWKEYRQVLKQRNALLRKQAPYNQFVPWDKLLSDLAATLDSNRRNYFSLLIPQFSIVLSQLTNSSCSLSYYKGWDRKELGVTLFDTLASSFESDRQKNYTQSGPHQADINIQSLDHKAKHTLSRGQQKIVLIALKLAQTRLLSNECLYLFDDLQSELDQTHLDNIYNYLNTNPGQYIITSVNPLISDSFTQSAFISTFRIDSGSLDSIK